MTSPTRMRRQSSAASPGSDYELGGENVPQMRPFEIVRDAEWAPAPAAHPLRRRRRVGALAELRARLTGHPPLLTRGGGRNFPPRLAGRLGRPRTVTSTIG